MNIGTNFRVRTVKLHIWVTKVLHWLFELEPYCTELSIELYWIIVEIICCISAPQLPISTVWIDIVKSKNFSNFWDEFLNNYFFHTPCAKCHFAHARVKQRALNQALHTSYEKILFDTRVRKWFYPRVAFSPSLRSDANVPTRIKSLFRTCIENYYFMNNSKNT